MNVFHSEDEILGLIDSLFPTSHAFLDRGRGSDCAQIASLGPLAVSTDLFLDGLHFRTTYFTPQEIGHKALAVNLSDLAAAGAIPAGFSLGILCPIGMDKRVLEGVLTGMANLAKRYDIPLSGGDISVSERLGFSITVWGKTVFPYGAEQPFLQRSARFGDVLFVVSPATSHPVLGLARLGLNLLEREGKDASLRYPKACHALCSPLPMLEAGQYLALVNGRLAHKSPGNISLLGAMDISDGLLRDIPRILGRGSGLGVDLELTFADLHPEIQDYYRATAPTEADAELEAVFNSIRGGDDYLLLCTAPQDVFEVVARDLAEGEVPSRVQRLGLVHDKGSVTWHGYDIFDVLGSGFDHFR